MLDPKLISKIGIGTRGVGGFAKKDTNVDIQAQVDAMAYMFSHGINFCEANMRYSEGYSVELLAQAFKKSGIKREDIFICQAIYIKDNKTIEDAQKELEKVMELFDTNYIDTVEFSMGSFLMLGFETITQWIDSLLRSKKVRYTSLTNGNLELLSQYHSHYKDNFFSHEVVFNFEVRANEELGIIGFGEDHNIKTVVYQPLRRNKTALRKRDIIKSLSNKYGKTPNQIILSRIIHKGYLPLTKSEHIEHIKEHLDATNFSMEETDHQALNNYKFQYIQPAIDRYKTGNGYGIDQLSNIFDEEYGKQHPQRLIS